MHSGTTGGYWDVDLKYYETGLGLGLKVPLEGTGTWT